MPFGIWGKTQMLLKKTQIMIFLAQHLGGAGGIWVFISNIWVFIRYFLCHSCCGRWQVEPLGTTYSIVHDTWRTSHENYKITMQSGEGFSTECFQPPTAMSCEASINYRCGVNDVEIQGLISSRKFYVLHVTILNWKDGNSNRCNARGGILHANLHSETSYQPH